MEFYTRKDLEQIEKEETLLKEYTQKICNIWEKDKCVSNTILLIKEIWYVLSFWTQIATSKLEYEDLKKILLFSNEYGRKHYFNNYEFLFFSGYMMSVLPYLFITDNSENEYVQIEENGNKMIEKAYEINCNEWSKLIMLRIYSGNKVREKINEYKINKIKKIIKLNNKYLPENSLFNIYLNETIKI